MSMSTLAPAKCGAFLALAIGILTYSPSEAEGQRRAPDYADIVYGTVGDRELLLDLYLPDGGIVAPLAVWVHGGAWRGGTKDQNFPRALREEGYAVASLDFRLSGESPFPAQVHDIKAALRFLRAMASDFGYSADRIALAGVSSGGHLAALVGLTGGDRDLEGGIGDHPAVSSEVQAVVSYCGASNLTTILAQSTPHGLSVREPALDLFIGGQPEDVPETARAASPVFHVDSADPPLLLIHGDQDPQMPINQSHELYGAYERASLDATFRVAYGAGHCTTELFSDGRWEDLLDFLQRTVGE
jgi:acetyl esterase/lipase